VLGFISLAKNCPRRGPDLQENRGKRVASELPYSRGADITATILLPSFAPPSPFGLRCARLLNANTRRHNSSNMKMTSWLGAVAFVAVNSSGVFACSSAPPEETESVASELASPDAGVAPDPDAGVAPDSVAACPDLSDLQDLLDLEDAASAEPAPTAADIAALQPGVDEAATYAAAAKPCKCNPSQVVCVVPPGQGAAVCDTNACRLFLSPQMCDLYKLHTGDYVDPAKILNNNTPPSNPSDVYAYCSVKHEGEHACDGPGLKNCQAEQNGYKEAIACMKNWCSSHGYTLSTCPWPIPSDINLAIGRVNLSKCLCQTGTSCQTCIDACTTVCNNPTCVRGCKQAAALYCPKNQRPYPVGFVSQ
jgi:hypothetical protein